MSGAEPIRRAEHRLNPSGSVKSVAASGAVVKHYREGLERELWKAHAVAAIGERFGFVVPAVLAHDEAEATITYQWLDGITPLRDLYLAYMERGDQADRCVTACRLAGETLAVLHRELGRVGAVQWTAPKPFSDEARRSLGPDWLARLDAAGSVSLHCDYGFGNVHLASGSPMRIALLDPSPNYYLTFDAVAVGSPYVDLGTLLGCLWGLVPLGHYVRLDRSRLRPLEEGFVAGYEAVAGWRLDRDVLDGATGAVVATYLARRLHSQWIGTAAARIIRGAARPGR